MKIAICGADFDNGTSAILKVLRNIERLEVAPVNGVKLDFIVVDEAKALIYEPLHKEKEFSFEVLNLDPEKIFIGNYEPSEDEKLADYFEQNRGLFNFLGCSFYDLKNAIERINSTSKIEAIAFDELAAMANRIEFSPKDQPDLKHFVRELNTPFYNKKKGGKKRKNRFFTHQRK